MSEKEPKPSSFAAKRRMEAAKPKDTLPEIKLRAALKELGIDFEVDVKPIEDLKRRADILFREDGIAVFVDGCFWHGCPIHGTQAKANAEFWTEKIKRNKDRDVDTNQRFEAAGWTVIRVWEHEYPIEAAMKIAEIIERRRNQ
ncbi:MAG TPA: DNA mismatch endonuclease Vsr [Bellilinea sp.]|nr:DNA mismatch endonuclease Vsr [Bellilinea sp.]